MAALNPALTPLGEAIEKALECVNECETSLATGDANVMANVETLVSQFANVRDAATSDETEIPVSAIAHVDEGKRPMAKMVEQILKVGKTNALAKGKVNAFRELEESLNREMNKLDDGKNDE